MDGVREIEDPLLLRFPQQGRVFKREQISKKARRSGVGSVRKL